MLKKYPFLFLLSFLGGCITGIITIFSMLYGVAPLSQRRSNDQAPAPPAPVPAPPAARHGAVRRLWGWTKNTARRLWGWFNEPHRARRLWGWISESRRAGGIQAIGAIVTVIVVVWGLVQYLATQSENQAQARLQAHLSAWQIIDAAQGQGGSGGRIEALESLNNDQVSLSGVTATGANLLGIRLPHADLSYAHLHQDVLSYADLSGAALYGADLSEADLSGADLSGANLISADLSGANLRGVNLHGANLLEARHTTHTQFAQVKSLQSAIMPDDTLHR